MKHALHRARFLAALALCTCVARAEVTAPKLTEIGTSAAWRLHNRGASAIADRPNAIRLDAREKDGVAWLVDSDFDEGTIEVALRGKNVPQQSFIGIAFRGVDDTTFDTVYFRPFNFIASAPERRARAVQYMSVPEFHWPKLRQEHPGKYEATVAPAPDPEGWFRTRIVVEDRKVSVFVNDATAPCLVVDELSHRRGGKIGLWVGNNSDGDFADLRITPREKAN